MEITTMAGVLVGLFDAEAVVGLALLAIVIVAIVHGLLADRHRGEPRSSERSHG